MYLLRFQSAFPLSHFYGPAKSNGETEYLRKYLTQFLREIGFRLSVCLIISVFCKSCEPICEPEIFLKNFAADFQANPTNINCKNTFTFSVSFPNLTIRENKHCRALEILKKISTCLTFIQL